MKRTAWIIAVALALALPPAGQWLEATMPRLLLLAVPSWFVLGIAAVINHNRNWTRGNPHGLTGLAWGMGTVVFWMIPRSVDAIRADVVAGQLMHVSLFVAGGVVTMSWRAMPFVVRGVLGIHSAAMTIALGCIYSAYTALLCGAFNLSQQRETGAWLLRLSPVVVLAIIVAGALSLRAFAHRRIPRRRGFPGRIPAETAPNTGGQHVA